MSSQTIKLSDKADALIAQLQKMIFNRRRKKVTAAGVVETLVESAAKSSGDKRFATSWKNLIEDIDAAAKMSYSHGSKPSGLSDQEWALVMSHRSRAGAKPAAKSKPAAKAKLAAKAKPAAKAKQVAKAKPAAKAKPVAKAKSAANPNPATNTVAATKTVAKSAASATSASTSDPAQPARRARKSPSSLARRMAAAAKQASLD